MSYVTNVIVSIGPMNEDLPDLLQQPLPMSARGERLRCLSEALDGWGGSKNPEVWLYAGAFNYLPWPEFVAWLESLPWVAPEEVQVFVQKEEQRLWGVWQFAGKSLREILPAELTYILEGETS